MASRTSGELVAGRKPRHIPHLSDAAINKEVKMPVLFCRRRLALRSSRRRRGSPTMSKLGVLTACRASSDINGQGAVVATQTAIDDFGGAVSQEDRNDLGRCAE
jgi:hypothetical protein